MKYFVVIGVLIIVCYFLAHWMVENNKFLARKFVLESEPLNRVNELVQVAKRIYNDKNFETDVKCDIEFVSEENKIIFVKVRNKNTEVQISKTGEVLIYDLSISKEVATFSITVTLWMISMLVFSCGYFVFFIFK